MERVAGRWRRGLFGTDFSSRSDPGLISQDLKSLCSSGTQGTGSKEEQDPEAALRPQWTPSQEVRRVPLVAFLAGGQCPTFPRMPEVSEFAHVYPALSHYEDLCRPRCVSFPACDTKTHITMPTPKDQLETTVVIPPFLLNSVRLNLASISIILCMR